MMDLKTVACLATLWVGANIASTVYSEVKANSQENPEPPPATVSIIVPAWHEPDNLLEMSLRSLKMQNIVQAYPEKFELILVGCSGVNLEIPRKYGYRILCCRRGKLNARHYATEMASGEIIVSADADSFYPPNSLNLLLKPFHQPGVVATTGTTAMGLVDLFAGIPAKLYWIGKMSGRFSAYWKWAYYATGGFNLNIDQTNIAEIEREEEWNFKRKLERLGRVVLVDTRVKHFGTYATPRGIRSEKGVKQTYRHSYEAA